MDTHNIFASATAVGVCVFILWLISLKMKDASIADIWWGPGFAVIAATGWFTTTPNATRYGLVTFVVTAWALRLGIHLGRRNLGHAEDRRYQAMRAQSPNFWLVSLFKVFVFQGSIQILVAFPIFAAAHAQSALNAWDLIGATVALAGVMIEALADHQLTQFKASSDSQGKVMDQGLWGYSRHPNYFGNAVLWIGLGIIGIASGGPWWSLIGPTLMIFLLLKVSGVSMLESTITNRRPGYQQYIEEVSAFIPWPPKKNRQESK